MYFSARVWFSIAMTSDRLSFSRRRRGRVVYCARFDIWRPLVEILHPTAIWTNSRNSRVNSSTALTVYFQFEIFVPN